MRWQRWVLWPTAVALVSAAFAAVAYFAWPSLICNGVPARVQIGHGVVKHGAIAKALDAFKWDMGRYPSSLSELYGRRHEVDDPRHNGPYLAGTFEELTDPWLNPFGYQHPGLVNVDSYDLWSWGPDKINDEGRKGSDDIKNWEDE